MEHLKNPSPTRDIELVKNSFGNWLFILREYEKDLYESSPFSSYEECLAESIRYLDELHNVSPILCHTKIFGVMYENG